jgi:ESCRT-I complex subunit TSG101
MALTNAMSTVQSEISALQQLSANLASNQKILQSSIASADRVIADAHSRKAKGDLPDVDDILVAPTVVGKQLYELVAEERGIGDAIWALQRALENGRISVGTWTKLTRGLARQRLLKAALIRKIGKGMGLEVA